MRSGKKLPPKAEGGFTYVEVLLAVAFLAIFAVPLLGLFFAGSAGIVHAGYKTKALHLCREKIEEAMGNGYSYYRRHESSRFDDKGRFLYLESEERGAMEGFPAFRRLTVIEGGPRPLPGGSTTVDLLRITVTVSWARGDGENQVTLIAEKSDSP